MMMKHDPYEWSVAFTVSPLDTWFKALSVQMEIADAMMRLAWSMTPMGMTGAEVPGIAPAKRRTAEIVQLPLPKRKPAPKAKPVTKAKVAAQPAPKAKPATKSKPTAPRKTARTKPAPKPKPAQAVKTPATAAKATPPAKPAARKSKRAPSKPPQPFKVDE